MRGRIVIGRPKILRWQGTNRRNRHRQKAAKAASGSDHRPPRAPTIHLGRQSCTPPNRLHSPLPMTTEEHASSALAIHRPHSHPTGAIGWPVGCCAALRQECDRDRLRLGDFDGWCDAFGSSSNRCLRDRRTFLVWRCFLAGLYARQTLKNTFSDRTHCTAVARILIPAECSAVL